MFKKLRDIITGEPYIKDMESGRQFRRTACALAWPYGQESGSVITLGELYAPPNQLGARRHVHVLQERRSFDAEELLQGASLMQRRYVVDVLVTPVDDERFMLLEEYNDRQRRARLPQLRTDDPVTWKGRGEGLIPYYAELAGRRLGAEKSLYFGTDCSGSLELERLSPDDARRRALEMPGVCALCWALEYIDANPMPEWGERSQVQGGPADPLGGY